MNTASANDAAGRGREKIAWVRSHMPILAALEEELRPARPFAGFRIALSIHLEAKTARLALALKELGAEVAVASSNPLSAKDDVVAALSGEVATHARYGASEAEYTAFLERVLAIRPHLVLDDGGDLCALLHGARHDLGADVIGACEETTTGLVRLRQLARDGRLLFPVVAVNDARMKHLFDNRHGTGQSVWDAIMRATNLLVAGKRVLVVGYGSCGRGIADRARGLGAHVTVAEVDPVRAAEALLEGFPVSTVHAAIPSAEFVITATGCIGAVTFDDLCAAPDGAILANAGHFDVEIDVQSLRARAAGRRVRDHVEEFTLPNGNRVHLLAEGRLVNLVAGDGHPAEIMDLSFAVQLLSLLWLARSGRGFAPGVYPVPAEVDEEVARRFLGSRGVRIDTLTPDQRAYLGLCGRGPTFSPSP
ncbi:MAG: Adenosylhomocysteinase [Candidatus Bipolaricaulis sibiricus]|uniref:Adenosylhomocysteinase n=1 Tax=Bipolaricaulis sibiricus TaxID=2501609 RepID=A0A410FVA8_BIPS1|nr:MAG: Adenosylhomocysteinase [Candidatus Bipolaricaulis sibiricus]